MGFLLGRLCPQPTSSRKANDRMKNDTQDHSKEQGRVTHKPRLEHSKNYVPVNSLSGKHYPTMGLLLSTGLGEGPEIDPGPNSPGFTFGCDLCNRLPSIPKVRYAHFGS